MLAAAVAWDGLAAELRLAAASYGSVVSGLTSGAWLGPASTSMAAAAAPYVAWMGSTAAGAEEAASQAKAAVAAYETAFAATVPPPVIAANRMQLTALVATNFFGQNSPAIAATEAHYGEMWAQDASAMYGYAGASSAASTVTPFMPPPHTTSPGALAGQAGAVPSLQTTSSTTPQLASATSVPQALQQLSSAPSSTSWLQGIRGGGLTGANWQALVRAVQVARYSLAIPQFLMSIGQQLTFGPGGTTAGAGGAWYPTLQFAGLGGLGNGGGAVSASVGQAGTIGRLSVPPSWAAAPSALDSASPGLLSAHAHGTATGAGGLLRGIPLAGAGRRASGGFIHRYGFRNAVMSHPPSAG